MMSYVIVFLVGLAGVFAGMFVGALMFAREPAQRERHKRVKKKVAKQIQNQEAAIADSDDAETDESDKGESSLLNKIDKSNSFTDFNCEIDGIDNADAIRNQMRKQDDSYRKTIQN